MFIRIIKNVAKSPVRPWFWITGIFSLLIIAVLSLISLTQFNGLHSIIFGLSNWIDDHRYAFLLWHMVIVVAIWVLWGKKVDRDFAAYQKNAKKKLSDDELKKAVAKAKRFRLFLIGFVVVVDLFAHLF